jgi:hypothetical protein
MEILKDRIDRGILEFCYRLYRNLWFIVKKKDGKYRLINYAAELNRHIIRDANMLLNVDIFLEKFVGYVVAFLIDFFSGYDYVKLNFKYKDMTAFMIPLGFFK